MNARKKALAQHLVCDLDEIEQGYDDLTFEAEGGEYLVLSDDEATEKANEYIEESLWSFNADFIIDHSNLPYEAKEMIASFQEKKCESANDTIKALISDLDGFMEDAVNADGRGHFINSYDGEEYEEQVDKETFYIYRTN